MQEQIDNISRKILKRSLKTARERSNTGTKMKNACGFINRLSKESLNLKCDDRNFQI